MNVDNTDPRRTLREIDTPALLLDLDAMERNLDRMARFFAQGPTRLRPHYKNHKCPTLAGRQLEAGAIGITCATLTEAEALVANGITDILISSELAGERKIGRLVELSSRADVKVVVDHQETVEAIGAACRSRGVAPGVLVDVNVGQDRTGVQQGNAVLELARAVVAEGLPFRGLMGYEGHVAHLPEGEKKNSAYDQAMRALIECRELLMKHQIAVEIVSTGGTGTYHLTPRFPSITEFQAGSYLVMDTRYAETCGNFELALSVLGTVISRTGDERIVLDAGLKSISSELGLPGVKSCRGVQINRLNAEHGVLEVVEPGVTLDAGDTVELWARYSDATINLHDRIYGIRNGAVEEVLRIEG
jgi:D-serine deaminase-like pyridoxal phosphate-dependent protein